jgi:hypothetical protein
MRRAILCLVALLCLLGAGTAKAAPEDPLFLFTPEPQPFNLPAIPPPAGYFEGPCGLAVDSAANIYVSDYYPEAIADHNAVDVFGPDPVSYPYDFRTQVREVDPLDGPCGLAVDGDGTLFVNDYHRSILKYETSQFPPPPAPAFPPFPSYYGEASTIDSAHPTGVALDEAAGRLYVNNRTHVSVYDSTGVPLDAGGGALEEGEQQLRIGAGDATEGIEDGYGLAVSSHPGTAGRLYVADAADGVVEVYDPALDLDDPVAVIDGSAVPGGGFVSLRDSAVAVDRVSGNLYVVDNLQPQFTESPQAAIYVFGPGGAYLGRLKHNVIDALPPGLAVDNSTEATQGRVYVTSGNTEFASVYAYGPGAETNVALPPLSLRAASGTGGEEEAGRPAGRARPATRERPHGAAPGGPGAAAGEGPALAQKGDLRVAVRGGFAPRALPRRGTAPISVRIGGHISAVGAAEPPQLRTLRIEFNRRGRMQVAGLPACRAQRIRIATSARALVACRAALVGRGSFEADVVLAGQQPYPTKGRLLLFNAGGAKRPFLLGHIYSAKPFATSFLVPFRVTRAGRGAFGTAIVASLPQALGNWGRVSAIELEMSRSYRHRGERRSFLAAGCPAPKGFPGALFPLARASFGFAGGVTLRATLTRSCGVR